MDEQDILDMPLIDQDGKEIPFKNKDGFFAVGFINTGPTNTCGTTVRPGKAITTNSGNVEAVITVKDRDGQKTHIRISHCLSFIAIFGDHEFDKFWLFWMATENPNNVKHTKASARCLRCDYDCDNEGEREELEEFLKDLVEQAKFPDYNIHRCNNFDQVRDVFQAKLSMSKIQADRAINYIKSV